MLKTVAVPSTGAVSLFTPSGAFRYGYIQNTGASDARVSFDGGTTRLAVTSFGVVTPGGTDPTATLGFLLPSLQQVWLPDLVGSTMQGKFGPWPTIRAIAVTGNTTIECGTDDLTSS